MDKTRDDAALETLAHTREITEHSRDIILELRELLEATQTPARVKIIELTQQEPFELDDAKWIAKSVGVYNPNAFTVYFAPEGGHATKTARAYPVPANSILVLPVPASTIEVGADTADLAAGTAVVFLFRYDSVQPAFIGKAV